MNVLNILSIENTTLQKPCINRSLALGSLRQRRGFEK